MEEGARKQKGQKKLPSRSEKTRSREMLERRPLKTVSLAPPAYEINPQILLDSYLEKDVRFAGVISGIPIALDCTNRTDVLQVIDRGKREKQIPWKVTYEQDAIFCLSVRHIKLSRRNAEEQLLLRVPIHEIASICYIKDDNQHILSLKFAHNLEPLDDVCHLGVIYCDSQESSEELCSLIGQCFQIVYTEATIEFFDKSLLEATSTLSVSSSNITTTTRSENSNSNRSTPLVGRSQFDPAKIAFISQSQQNLDQGHHTTTSNSSASRSLPMNRCRKSSQTPSDAELSGSAKELLGQYMSKLHTKLTSSELREFAHLLTASADGMPFHNFCDKLLELYGPDRKHLISGMRPFIPEKNYVYFENFLARIGVNGNSSLADSSLSGESYSHRIRPALSAASSSISGQAGGDEYDRILNDICGDLSNLEASVDINIKPSHFLPDS